MNHDLEIALETARRWRDLGNAILLAGILAEILIEASWPERPSVFTLRWCDHVRAPKNVAILMAGLITLGGLFLERREGQIADDKADQIRGNLQERVIAVSPRYWLLPLTVRHELAIGLKAFAGQRVAIMTNTRQLTRDPYNEIGFTQIAIAAMLDESKWLNPWGQSIMKTEGNGSTCTDCLEGPSNTFETGILIEADSRASENTKKAVHGLWEAFKSQHFNGFGWSSSANLQPELTNLSPPLPRNDFDVIVVTVGTKP